MIDRASRTDHNGEYQMPPSLDELDRRIITLLLEEPQSTNGEIARRLHSSASTIRRRRQRLTDEGIIRESIVADPFALGYTMMALIGIQIRQDRMQSIADQLKDLPQLRFIGLTLGRYDMLAEAWFRSNDELLEFLQESLGKIDGVQRTETLQVLRFLKYAYDWGQTDRDLMPSE